MLLNLNLSDSDSDSYLLANVIGLYQYCNLTVICISVVELVNVEKDPDLFVYLFLWLYEGSSASLLCSHMLLLEPTVTHCCLFRYCT